MANGNGNSGLWLKLIPIFLTIVGMLIAAVVWANNSNSALQSRMDQKDRELLADAKESLVKKEEFTRVQECLDNTKASLSEIKSEQKYQRDKMDEILRRLPPRR